MSPKTECTAEGITPGGSPAGHTCFYKFLDFTAQQRFSK